MIGWLLMQVQESIRANAKLFSEADLFSTWILKDNEKFIKNKKVKTSFIQKLPFAKKNIEIICL